MEMIDLINDKDIFYNHLGPFHPNLKIVKQTIISGERGSRWVRGSRERGRQCTSSR